MVCSYTPTHRASMESMVHQVQLVFQDAMGLKWATFSSLAIWSRFLFISFISYICFLCSKIKTVCAFRLCCVCVCVLGRKRKGWLFWFPWSSRASRKEPQLASQSANHSTDQHVVQWPVEKMIKALKKQFWKCCLIFKHISNTYICWICPRRALVEIYFYSLLFFKIFYRASQDHLEWRYALIH